MNFIQLVGTVSKMPEQRPESIARNYSEMTLAVTSNFREATGQFRTDDFRICLWRGISDTVAESIKLGDLLAVKGRIEVFEDQYIVIAEHIEFLHHK